MEMDGDGRWQMAADKWAAARDPPGSNDDAGQGREGGGSWCR